ncbi:MAG: HlyD family efflux transporter periplasmic adaptor subunit [Candidatus Glassbacteria bacterium]|nr:HlyD family efflux transporter periplasmic adaptor subunit [Candidatus Glassbacteria bacterium]
MRILQKKKHGPGLTAAAALALLLLAAGCGNDREGSLGSGTFEATEVDVSALLAGTLLKLDKREGDPVSAGELLAQIDAEKLVLERELAEVQLEAVKLELDLAGEKVSAARIQLANDRKKLDRIRTLLTRRSATQQQVDDLATAVELDRNRLEAALKELQGPEIRRRELETRLRLLDRNIADSRVLSPITGQVIGRYLEPGEVVAAGQAILKIADLSLMEIKVYLPASLLGSLKLGQAVSLRADGAPQRQFGGEVVWISPKAEFTPKNVQTAEARAELVYAVKIEVPNPDGVLKIGMPADVYL